MTSAFALFRSTPPRGSDSAHPRRFPPSGGFDPRPREGATWDQTDPVLPVLVSIHAPASERPWNACWTPRGRGFRSTPPRGSDPPAATPDTRLPTFRSTPPRGSDGRTARAASHPRGFDPRPREGATTASVSAPAASRFRSTPPRGSDSARSGRTASGRLFRSTPPRGSDPARAGGAAGPRRFDPRPREGATGARGPNPCPARCFDPRPREGATWCCPASTACGCSFDPRPREGATLGRVISTVESKVSIHAPARERHSSPRPDAPMTPFRSTPPRGSDLSYAAGRPKMGQFRSTPPRGSDEQARRQARSEQVSIHAPARERRMVHDLPPGKEPFRSTPPRGSDCMDAALRGRLHVSIHAPARERRLDAVCYLGGEWFRSTPPRGSDARARSARAPRGRFDPRPREGATWLRTRSQSDLGVSIHAPARERPPTVTPLISQGNPTLLREPSTKREMPANLAWLNRRKARTCFVREPRHSACALQHRAEF